MTMTLFAGLDSSCYATSMALLNARAELIWEQRLPLKVKKGSRGLRQSEMVFQHLKNMPRLWEEAQKVSNYRLSTLAYTCSPRPGLDSYMPVFKVSEVFGKSIALAAGINYVQTSHQEGHIAAGVWSTNLKSNEFLAAHISGGTTEILLVKDNNGKYDIEIVGGTLDLNAGQFVDRIGVAMGMPFPSGRFLEEKALELSTEPLATPLAVKDSWFSFSGPATFVERELAKGVPFPAVARGVEICIANSLVAAIKAVSRDVKVKDLLAIGGVAANQFIRQKIVTKLRDMRVYFPPREYAGDNAIGVAYLGYLRENNG